MRIIVLLLAALLAACTQEKPAARGVAPVAQTASSNPVLSPAAYGPIAFGARLEHVEKAIGSRMDVERPIDPGCDYVRFKTLPGVRFMVEGGIITRADAEAGVPNILNIEVGTSLEAIRKTRPDARIDPHKYDPGGHYVTFNSPDSHTAIVMEEGAGVIKVIRAGLQPSVGYVEGCA
ncbi:MAG TPA: hypothetical protein VJT81_06970 [Burkholderiales bacterium]|nr:hypothetical protein [Burkholderiales bacterium]